MKEVVSFEYMPKRCDRCKNFSHEILPGTADLIYYCNRKTERKILAKPLDGKIYVENFCDSSRNVIKKHLG